MTMQGTLCKLVPGIVGNFAGALTTAFFMAFVTTIGFPQHL